MIKAQPKVYSRDEIYRMLLTALAKKLPLPPADWSVARLDEEILSAGREFEPNLFSRHRDAFATSVFYLVVFARRMPEWINLSVTNERVRNLCGDLADEIERITYEPEAVIARHGKLKAWLKAKLGVQTCLIYNEETTRVFAEKEEAKRCERVGQNVKIRNSEPISRTSKRQSDLVRSILHKVCGQRTEKINSSQPSLF